MTKKHKGAASVFILGIYSVIILMIVWLYAIQTRMINHVRDEFDNGLLMSLLGAATINVEEYGRSGQRVIHDTYKGDEDIFLAEANTSCLDEALEKAIFRFQQLMETNVEMNADGISYNTIVVGPVKIEEFKIFNVYSNNTGQSHIYEFTWKDGLWSQLTHEVDERVYVPGAGDRGHAVALVEDTTVYAKISFSIALYPYFRGLAEHIPTEDKIVTVDMQRCVSIPKN